MKILGMQGFSGRTVTGSTEFFKGLWQSMVD